MRIDLQSDRGEQFDFVGAITKGGIAYPTGAWTSFTVVFAARDRNGVTVVSKTSASTGVTLGAAASGTYSVHILKADTAALTKAALWEYDVTLIEPDGTETVCAKGSWRIGEASST